jgi:hypothetical protein
MAFYVQLPKYIGSVWTSLIKNWPFWAKIWLMLRNDFFKKRLQEIIPYGKSSQDRCIVKSVIAAGALTGVLSSSIKYGFTYKQLKDEYGRLQTLGDQDAEELESLIQKINESFQEEMEFNVVQGLKDIIKLLQQKKPLEYKDYYCQEDVELYQGRRNHSEESEEVFQSAKDKGIPIIVGICRKNNPNLHYVVLLKDLATQVEWILDLQPWKGGDGKHIYQIKDLQEKENWGASINKMSRYGILRYKTTKTFVPVERYWFLEEGTVDKECWIRKDTQALRAKLAGEGIIGVYETKQIAKNENPNSAWSKQRKEPKPGELEEYGESWINGVTPTKAIHVKMCKEDGKVGIVGVFSSAASAKEEAENEECWFKKPRKTGSKNNYQESTPCNGE